MELNPKITEVLQAHGIDASDGIAYLLAIYFEHRPSYTPPILIQKINVTNILGIVDHKLSWLVPLFLEDTSKDTITDDKWAWVNEMRELFEKKNSARKGPKSAVLSRMKTYFSSNPDVRQDEVMGAVRMYLNQVHPDFVTSTHYFITKGTGQNKVSYLEEWIEKYRAWQLTQVSTNEGSKDITSIMQ